MHHHAIIYTDGACIGRAALRPGGWATLIVMDHVERVIAGSHPATTISAMELTGVVNALEAVPPGSSVILHTDSAAIVAGITQRLPWWRSRGWRTIKGRKVQDRGLWRRLADLAAARQVTCPRSGASLCETEALGELRLTKRPSRACSAMSDSEHPDRLPWRPDDPVHRLPSHKYFV